MYNYFRSYNMCSFIRNINTSSANRDQGKKAIFWQHNRRQPEYYRLKNKFVANRKNKYFPRGFRKMTYAQRKSIYKQRHLNKIKFLKYKMFFGKYPEYMDLFRKPKLSKEELADIRFEKFY